MRYFDHHIHLKGLISRATLELIDGKKQEPNTKPYSFKSFQEQFNYLNKVLPDFDSRLRAFEIEMQTYSNSCNGMTLHFSAIGEEDTVEMLIKLDETCSRQDIPIGIVFAMQRRYLNAEVLDTVEHCISNNKIIAGGLVGDESIPVELRILKDYLNLLNSFGVPVRFHLGESNITDKKLDEIEIYANSPNIETIAHGNCLYYPWDIPQHFRDRRKYIIDLLKEKKVTFEICPTSNMHILGMKSDDFKRFMDLYFDYVLGSDDPGVFETNIIKENEYWQNHVLNN